MNKLIPSRLKWLLLFFIIAISCNDSLKENASRYGLQYNTFRKKVGLPLLDSNWKIAKNSKGQILWLNDKPSDSAVFLSKRIFLFDNKIYREENHFIGVKKFRTVDGVFFEDMYVSIEFHEETKPLKLSYEYRADGELKFLNGVEANAMLTTWVGKR